MDVKRIVVHQYEIACSLIEIEIEQNEQFCHCYRPTSLFLTVFHEILL